MAHFEKLYAEHGDYVEKIAVRLCGPGAEAEDLFQEVFLRIYRFLPSYKGGSIKAWIRRITVNSYYSSTRARRHTLSLDADSRVLELVDPELTTSGKVQRNQMRRRLGEAVAMLPEEGRNVLVMREFEELEYKEIASRLEIPIGTVRSRLTRARAALRRLLEEDLSATGVGHNTR